MPTTFTLELSVRFAETDAMGIVHHSNYIIWFEAARVALMEAAGIPYRQVADAGYHFAVTALEIEYRSPARFGDIVHVLAEVETLRSRQINFRYEVRRADSRTILASGRSKHICVDLQNKMTKIPQMVMECLEIEAASGRQQLGEER
jgi:acyl-CoA thioester hydrolase